MTLITPDQVTPALRSLFRRAGPLPYRCFAVLEGNGHPGKIILQFEQAAR
jgi:hypothetical protein